MAEKIASYTGGVHVLTTYLKEKWNNLKEEGALSAVRSFKSRTGERVGGLKEQAIQQLNRTEDGDFSHLYRRKSRMEMTRISAAVMGIEFCYAAETAFVSPTLLKIGVRHAQMTLIWCLSPFVGFFLTPILGSLSDNCRSQLGRRRPFIVLLSIGIILGLLLVPNGKEIGVAFGDEWQLFNETQNFHYEQFHQTLWELNTTDYEEPIQEVKDGGTSTTRVNLGTHSEAAEGHQDRHPWGVFFTIVGTMLLDFDADACQSPSRAYLLDVTLPEDHANGLATFTVMAGLGGGFGYAMGGINWEPTFIGRFFGGHVRAVFTLVTFIYIGCVFCTLCSFKEMPLDLLNLESKSSKEGVETEEHQLKELQHSEMLNYGAVGETSDLARPKLLHMPTIQPRGTDSSAMPGPEDEYETSFAVTESESPVRSAISISHRPSSAPSKDVVVDATFKQYLWSIIYMPKSLRILCLTNLFCWMSLVSYSLYFTDFVGEAVFGGDPMARDGTPQKEVYEEGVRFGCWGMALYSLSCSAYSFMIEKLVKRFRARPVYICGQLVYSFGMVFMASLRHKAAVIIFSSCAGVMYATLFTMPYLLVAHYHASSTFDIKSSQNNTEPQVRGLGTDVAIVSSMVFLAQFILSSCMGSIVSFVGSTTAVVCMASFLAFCGAVSATQVVYLDL